MRSLGTTHDENLDDDQIPLPTDPVLDGSVRAIGQMEQPSVYADTQWNISPGHLGRHSIGKVLDFDLIPEGFQSETKFLIYNVLNRRPRALPRSAKVEFIAVSTVLQLFIFMRHYTTWLSQLPGNGFHQVDDVLLLQYMRSQRTKRVAVDAMVHYSRVWAHNHDHHHCPPLPKPPWWDLGITHFVGSYDYSLENSTPPIRTDVISPMFRAALTICESYVCGAITLGNIDKDYRSHDAIKRRAEIAEGHAVQTNSAKPVRSNPFGTELRAAAAIVLLYLTGMRSDEILNLRRGCLEVVEAESSEDGVKRSYYLIHGRTFKNVRNRDMTLNTEGAERDVPWVTLQAAETAIKALEMLSSDPTYLFAHLKSPGSGIKRYGDGVTAYTINADIVQFINFWNKRAGVKGLERIPVFEPDGTASEVARLSNSPSLRSFRRTLAWHIANQPRGELALALQYGHIHLATSMGYAGRAASGFPQEIGLDFAISAWDTLVDISDSLEEGVTVSGPAGSRLLASVRAFEHTFKGTVRNERQLNRFRQSGGSQIYDNPSSFLVCVYDERTALCSDPSNGDESALPALSQCVSKCPNIARSDSHIERQIERDRNRASLGGLPPLVRKRIETARDDTLRLEAKHTAESKAKDW